MSHETFGPAPAPSVTSRRFQQRGNTNVMALRWDENQPEVEEFIRTRDANGKHLEFFVNTVGDLLIDDPLRRVVYRLPQGVWVVDQWREETRNYHRRWLLCEPGRFDWLYKEDSNSQEGLTHEP